MKKIHPVHKVKSIAKDQSIKLSEKAIAKTVEAKNFLTDFADFFLFLARTFKETFSRDFEFKEFLRQSFQIGYKSLPLISVTGFIMGLVLTIQARTFTCTFRSSFLTSRNGSCISHQGNGAGYNSIDMRRENWFRHGRRVRFNESD